MANVKKPKTNDGKLKETIAELDKTSKLLVRRDLELTEINTELDEKYEELKFEKRKIESIFKNLTDGLIFFDNSNKARMINPRAKEIFNIKEETEKGFKELLSSIREKGVKEILFGKHAEKIREIRYKDFILQVSSIEVEDMGHMKIIRDITREKQIDKMKSEFISIAAHQLRTPLTAIKWTLKLILEGDAGKLNKEQEELLIKGYKSNERIIKLINDLLNVSRIEEGRFGFNFKKQSFEKVLSEAIQAVSDMAEIKHISIVVNKPKRLPKIYIDEEKMTLALTNLADNAVKYTKEYGKIEITLDAKSKNKLKILIKDNGIGIQKNEQKKIFTKFFRGSNAVLMQTEGNGLGLFLVKNIIEKHGGRIYFSSKINKGAEIVMELLINPS